MSAYTFTGQLAYLLAPIGPARQFSTAAWTRHGSTFMLGSYERLQLVSARQEGSLEIVQDLQVRPPVPETVAPEQLAPAARRCADSVQPSLGLVL